MQIEGGADRSLRATLWYDLLLRSTLVGSIVGDTSWVTQVLECPEIEEMGPDLADVMVHLELRNPTGNFGVRVCIQYKYEDGDWSTPDSNDILLAEVNAAGYPSPTVFSDRTRLGRRRIRIVAQYHSKAGGAATDKGEVSIAIAVRRAPV